MTAGLHDGHNLYTNKSSHAPQAHIGGLLLIKIALFSKFCSVQRVSIKEEQRLVYPLHLIELECFKVNPFGKIHPKGLAL